MMRAMEPDRSSGTTIRLRVSRAEGELIDRAVELEGVSRAQFMLRAALEDAREVLMDRSRLSVDGPTFAAIVDRLGNPSPVSGELRKTLEARNPWDRG